ncbi:MAG: hypothetical protein ABR552_01280 [Actinomycetota bacterium]
MRKFLALAALSIAVFGFVPAHANAHTVSGTILVPSVTEPTVGTTLGGTLTRQERCAFLAGGHTSDGLVGYAVDLTDADAGHSFTLSSDNDQVYVAFYSDLGTCDGVVTGGGPTVEASAAAPAASISGTIPAFSTTALVVVLGTPNGNFSMSIA